VTGPSSPFTFAADRHAVAMGATLPAMDRVVAGLGREGRGIGALYASNTFGAVLGVLAAAFWLVPEFGLARTAVVCAALNLLCAAAVLAWRGAPSARATTGLVASPRSAPER